MAADLAARLRGKVAISAAGCWLWTGHLDACGYAGTTLVDGKWYKPHRLSYEIFVGPIPDGLQIDHLCCVKRCINPKHLEPVTQAENIRRRNALVTHCKSGHPFNAANTYVSRDGRRHCRPCNRRRVAAYQGRRVGVTS